MSATTRDKLEFVYAMVKHSTATLADCQRLMRYAATHKAIAERQCNGYKLASTPGKGCAWDSVAAERDQLKQERIRWKIGEIVERVAKDAVYSSDPRGATVKIVAKDGYTNDFGGEGICVPS